MSKDYLENTAKSANTFLTRWKHARVLVRSTGVLPRSLEIVLFHSFEMLGESNLCLYFEPIWMHGYFEWNNSDMDVAIVAAASSPIAGRTEYESVLEIRDASSGFRCLTESLEIKENVKLG